MLSAHGVFDWPSAPHPDFHLHARPEPVEDRHQAIDGEPPEVRIADAREVGGRNPCAAVCGAHAQAFPIQRLDDFRREDSFELLGIRVLAPEMNTSCCRFPFTG